jgi:hypothetical protein
VITAIKSIEIDAVLKKQEQRKEGSISVYLNK